MYINFVKYYNSIRLLGFNNMLFNFAGFHPARAAERIHETSEGDDDHVTVYVRRWFII